MKTIAFLVLLLSNTVSFSQDSIYEWGEGMTYYKGTIDEKRFSLNEIKQIYNYLIYPSSEIYTMAKIWKVEESKKISAEKIDAYFKSKMTGFEKLKLPQGTYWDSLLLLRKRELTERYEHERLFLTGFADPKLLYDFAYQDCKEYVDALNGTNENLLLAWRKLVDFQKTQNGYPENLEKRYQNEFSSSDKLIYARITLMLFGWGNCHNKFVFNYEEDGRLIQEFMKLFKSVEIEEEYEDWSEE